MASLLELKRAGFSEDEIALWYNEKKLELDSAGFNRVDQANYFDIPFESKNPLIDGLIGNKDFEDTIKPQDKELSPDKLTEKNNEETLQIDNNTAELQKKQLQEYDKFLNDQMIKSLQANDEMPYNWKGLEQLAFINRNKHNVDVNKKIYDVDGKPIHEDYYKEFKLNEDVSDVPALQPELRDQANYYATLVNTGILTPNEAREALRLETIDGFDQPRVPANIAGSAANPEQGGRPEETPPAEEE